MSEKPTLTARDLSYNVATAGAAAKAEAEQMGGDPAHLRSLVAAARDGTSATGSVKIKGAALRQDDLLVTLCLSLYQSVFGEDLTHQAAGLKVKTIQDDQWRSIQSITPMEDPAAKMMALASLALIFTQGEDAWDLLDLASDAEAEPETKKARKREFHRAALEVGGDLGQADIDALANHIAALMRRRPGSVEDGPGKAEGPAS